MNVLNLIKLANLGVVSFRQPEGEPSRIELTKPGGGLAAYEGPPHIYSDDSFTPGTAGASNPRMRVFRDTDASTALVARALDETSAAGEAMRAAAADDSPSRKATAVQVAVGAALQAIGGLYQSLVHSVGVQLDNRESALFDPQKPDTTEALIDIEIRARTARMDAAKWRGLLQQLELDEAARTLLALRRDPMFATYSKADQERINVAWVAGVAAAKGLVVRQYQAARENFEWSCGIVKWLVANLTNWSLSGAPALDRLAVCRLLRQSAKMGADDIGSLLELTDDQVTFYETKLMQEADAAAAAAAAEAAGTGSRAVAA